MLASTPTSTYDPDVGVDDDVDGVSCMLVSAPTSTSTYDSVVGVDVDVFWC